MSRPLDINQAAARVRRSKRAIQRWIEKGALRAVSVRGDDGQVRTVVMEDDLLVALRAHLRTKPTRRADDPDR